MNPTDAGIPAHIGVIMDGNGRWAKQRKLPRIAGHKTGIQATKRLVTAAIKYGVKYLSLYAFSTENWKRSTKEVSHLMALIARGLRNEYDFYRKNNIRLFHSGDLSALSREVQREIEKVTEDTKHHTLISVNIAINYGSRNEILRAAKSLCTAVGEEAFLNADEEDLAYHLDTQPFPDPDLIIRSGQHLRLSNFLLWQSAYSELYFSDTLWPDWTEDDLSAAIAAYQRRKRNFGAILEK